MTSSTRSVSTSGHRYPSNLLECFSYFFHFIVYLSLAVTPMIAWTWDPAKQLQLKPKEIVYVGDTVWQAQALWAQGLVGQLSNLVVRVRKKVDYLKRKIQDKYCYGEIFVQSIVTIYCFSIWSMRGQKMKKFCLYLIKTLYVLYSNHFSFILVYSLIIDYI